MSGGHHPQPETGGHPGLPQPGPLSSKPIHCVSFSFHSRVPLCAQPGFGTGGGCWAVGGCVADRERGERWAKVIWGHLLTLPGPQGLHPWMVFEKFHTQRFLEVCRACVPRLARWDRMIPHFTGGELEALEAGTWAQNTCFQAAGSRDFPGDPGGSEGELLSRRPVRGSRDLHLQRHLGICVWAPEGALERPFVPAHSRPGHQEDFLRGAKAESGLCICLPASIRGPALLARLRQGGEGVGAWLQASGHSPEFPGK